MFNVVEPRSSPGVDEFTQECLCIRVRRQLKAVDVTDVLADLFILRNVPRRIRPDNGPKFTATAVRGWITGVRASTVYIEPDSSWENNYVESFNGKLRDELLNPKVFNSLTGARSRSSHGAAS